MGIKEAESKYLAKQKKRRGLQKTRFYCQICERQCLDENGFKCHVKSELHMKNVKKKLEETNGDSNKVLNDYSEQMENDFLRLLRVSHGEKFVSLNKFYQEYISNRDHVHLNSTRWKTITGFAHYLAKRGKVRLEESSAEGGPVALRIAYLREQSKGKQYIANPVASSTSTNDTGVAEEITYIDTLDCRDGDGDGDGHGYDGVDLLLSRQLESAETAFSKRAASAGGETSPGATAGPGSKPTPQEEEEEAEKGPAQGNTLASRGKVAFTLKKKQKKKKKTNIS